MKNLVATHDPRHPSTPVILLVVVAVVAAIGLLSPSAVWENFTVQLLVYVTITVGLFMFVGNTGVFSFGHASFAALGGYITGLATIDPLLKQTLMPEMPGFLQQLSLPWVPAMLLGGLVAAVTALLLWSPLMRLTGLGAVLATAAFLVALHSVIDNATRITNGSAGLPSIPIQTTVPVAAAVAAGAVLIAFGYQSSRRGLLMRAAREDEAAARGTGINILRERVVALVLSAFVVGCGGALFAMLVGSVTPTTFYLHLTFLMIEMMVIGGVRSLSGAVLGSVVVVSAMELLRAVEQGASVGPLALTGFTGMSEVGLALLLLLVLWLRPSGLMGSREVAVLKRRDRAARSGAAGAEPAATTATETEEVAR